MNVKSRTENGVATVTLDRPDKMNALSEAMYADMSRIFADLASDDAVRAVVVTGAGRAFCSGSDVSGMEKTDPVSNRTRMKLRHRMIQNLVNIEKPVIAAVNGACVGIGFSIALACDLIVAAESARFSQVFKRSVSCRTANPSFSWFSISASRGRRSSCTPRACCLRRRLTSGAS